MTKEELIKRLAERNATKQAEKQQATEPTPQAEKPTKKVRLESFTILWHEGTNEYQNKTVTTWKEADSMMKRIYYSHEGAGYTKVKINVIWKNGAAITDRADCSDSSGDYCGNRETIGQYLSRQNSVMYDSNLQVGDRVNLSFEDEPEQAPEQDNKTNLSEVPEMLKQLLGIVETIEESNDTSETALIKASEQLERAKAYTLYLQAITPILEAKVNALIEAKHTGKTYRTNIQQPSNVSLN